MKDRWDSPGGRVEATRWLPRCLQSAHHESKARFDTRRHLLQFGQPHVCHIDRVGQWRHCLQRRRLRQRELDQRLRVLRPKASGLQQPALPKPACATRRRVSTARDEAGRSTASVGRRVESHSSISPPSGVMITRGLPFTSHLSLRPRPAALRSPAAARASAADPTRRRVPPSAAPPNKRSISPTSRRVAGSALTLADRVLNRHIVVTLLAPGRAVPRGSAEYASVCRVLVACDAPDRQAGNLWNMQLSKRGEAPARAWTEDALQ